MSVNPTEHSVELKTCSRCKKDLPATEEFFYRNTHQGVKKHLKNFCRNCDAHDHKIVYGLKRTAPPIPSVCDCCGTDLTILPKRSIHLDHCKETETFRGWLCKNCNIGLGMLGDNVEGLQTALKYLNRHEAKDG